MLWSALDSRTARKTWHLPDRANMEHNLQIYLRTQATDLTQQIYNAGSAFTRVLEGNNKGTDVDRDEVTMESMLAFVGHIAGYLGAFGKFNLN
jgi:hypothetical protein